VEALSSCSVSALSTIPGDLHTILTRWPDKCAAADSSAVRHRPDGSWAGWSLVVLPAPAVMTDRFRAPITATTCSVVFDHCNPSCGRSIYTRNMNDSFNCSRRALLCFAAGSSLWGLSRKTVLAQVLRGQNELRIPFELDGNIVVLKVRVSESEPLPFVLDTGAGVTVLDIAQARRLGLQNFEDYPALLKVPADYHRLRGVNLALSGLELANRTIGVGPMDANGLVHGGRHFYGVLGRDFFSQFVVEIDYIARVVTLYDPKTYRYSGTGQSIPIELERWPIVRAKVTTFRGETMERLLMIDSGSHSTLNYEVEQFPAKTIEQNVLDLTNQVTSRVSATFGRAERIEIGQFVIEKPVVGFTHSFPLPPAQGLIGGGLLRRFKVTFDYSRRQTILEPNEHFHEPFEFNMSGAFLISDLPNSQRIKVFSVMPQSPAAEAGLHDGDLIVAIDGTPSEKLDIANVMMIEMSAHAGRTFRLTVQRGNQHLRIRIKLRRLI
jgi:hypothetical protein